MAVIRTKWNSMGLPENPLPLILFFFKWRTYMFEKYQRAILGPSIPVLGKTFYWVFFFLSQPKKWIFDQNNTNLGEKTEVTLVWESVLKLLLYIYLNKVYITLYCAVLYLKQSLIAALSASWTVS